MAACRSCGVDVPAGARFCPACGVRVDAPTGREERKLVTVLFADLVGSTAAASDRDPEDVRAAVQPKLALIRDELERCGGTVEKYVGDAVMAVFGAPLSHEDDAERAVRAALAIRDALGTGVKVAVNTGEAVVSVGARPELGEGIASGDVLNTTYRIEAAAPPGAVLVGDVTYRATFGAIEYGERRRVAAKGKDEPVAVWEALYVRGPARALESRPPLAPLVGRREELSLILDTLARAKRDRTVQLVTLVGDPGIGKSRLVWELERALEGETGLVTWRRGRCLPYGDRVTFWALAEIAKTQTGILETDTPEETEAKLKRGVRDLLADPAEAAWAEKHLRPLVGLAGEPVAGERRDDAFSAWRRFFEALAEWGPLVLVLEDIHWADDGLLDFLDRLADAADGPMLLLCTARPELHERRPTWGARRNAATIALPPLTRDETRTLVQYLLRQSALPEQLHQTLVDRAEGNALYTEEFVRMLVERGFLRRDGVQWQLVERDLPLPESVQGIVASRLDALGAEKSLLHDAAVLGRSFWVGALAAMSGDAIGVIEARLRSLEQKELVRRQRTSALAGETEYVFHHAVVRDVAYGQVPRAVRSEKHRAAAEWLESVAADRLDRAELLAHHLWKASVLARATGRVDDELSTRALAVLREAGDRALSLNAFEAAANYFEAALDLSPPPEDRPVIQFCYAKALFRIGQASPDLLAKTTALMLDHGHVREGAECEAMLGEVAWRQGKRQEAFEHFELASELLADAPASPSKAYVLSNLSRFRVAADEPAEALRLGRAALAMAEELDLAEIRAHALNTIGIARTISGDTGGLDDLERSVALSVQRNSPEAVRGYFNLGSVVANLGDLRRAFELHAKGRELAERFGETAWIEWFTAERLYEHYWRGEWDDALTLANRLVADAPTATARRVELDGSLVRGWIQLARGNVEAALTDAQSAEAFSREADDPQNLYPALAFRARVLLAAGDRPGAEQIVDELLRLSSATLSFPSFWILDLAFTLDDLGRSSHLADGASTVRARTRWLDAADAIGRADFTSAADVCAEIGARPEEARARVTAAGVAIAEGRREDADEQLTAALDFCRGAGAWAFQSQAEALLAR